jgi:hypothetical protein
VIRRGFIERRARIDCMSIPDGIIFQYTQINFILYLPKKISIKINILPISKVNNTVLIYLELPVVTNHSLSTRKPFFGGLWECYFLARDTP